MKAKKGKLYYASISEYSNPEAHKEYALIVMCIEDQKKTLRFQGIVIYSKNSFWEIGDYSRGWDSYEFKLYEGKLILNNK